MTKPFDILEAVDKDKIITLFSKHEENRPIEKDAYAYDRIANLKERDDVLYYKIKFNESITDFLMLPHHNHNKIEIIPPYGKSVSDALNLFFEQERQNPTGDCINKIRTLKKHFFDNNVNDWNGDFILIGDDKDIAHPGSHYSHTDKEQYYIFNGFHRIMAYLLKIYETGKFRPLFIYYAQSKNAG